MWLLMSESWSERVTCCVFTCMWIIFFFFQAEDGIRVKLVTGVQTCALPILLEGVIVNLINSHTEQKERRRHYDTDQDRVDAEARINDVGDKGPEHDERRMGDI